MPATTSPPRGRITALSGKDAFLWPIGIFKRGKPDGEHAQLTQVTSDLGHVFAQCIASVRAGQLFRVRPPIGSDDQLLHGSRKFNEQVFVHRRMIGKNQLCSSERY